MTTPRSMVRPRATIPRFAGSSVPAGPANPAFRVDGADANPGRTGIREFRQEKLGGGIVRTPRAADRALLDAPALGTTGDPRLRSIAVRIPLKPGTADHHASNDVEFSSPVLGATALAWSEEVVSVSGGGRPQRLGVGHFSSRHSRPSTWATRQRGRRQPHTLFLLYAGRPKP